MSILISMLASSNCSEQWVPASLAPCSDLCAGSRHGQQPPGNQRPVAAWPRLWFTAQADSHDKQTSHPASKGKFCAGLSLFWCHSEWEMTVGQKKDLRNRKIGLILQMKAMDWNMLVSIEFFYYGQIFGLLLPINSLGFCFIRVECSHQSNYFYVISQADRNPASKSWPNLSFKTSTKLQPQNLEQTPDWKSRPHFSLQPS